VKVKKYIIFIVSFLVAFLMLQVLIGMFLTFVYTPDIKEAWSLSANLPQETVIVGGKSQFLLSILYAFIASSIAYIISNKILAYDK
jgi:ABC-type Fe3+ transport system permease subunit